MQSDAAVFFLCSRFNNDSSGSARLDRHLQALTRCYPTAKGPPGLTYYLCPPRLLRDGLVVCERSADVDLVAPLRHQAEGLVEGGDVADAGQRHLEPLAHPLQRLLTDKRQFLDSRDQTYD